MNQTKRIRLSALSFVLIVALIALVGVFAIGIAKPAETAYAGWSGEGSGTATDPYLIGTKEQLETYRDIVNGINGETRNTAACARLTADIDLEGSESNQWVPIGDYSRFQGIFDGAGHTISGLYINQPNKSCIGLFGYVKNATIKKVTVQGSITGCRKIGGIVGDIYGDSNGSRCTIYKCTNECTIYSTLVGNADATASNQTGGIVGYVYEAGTVVSACVNKGNVSSAVRTTAYQSGNRSYTFHEAYVAGIVGFSICGAITIKNCVNEGNISSATGVAGIVAYATGAGSVITGCFNKGNLTSSPLSSNCKCGGIAGNGYADITYCGNEGNITANGSGVAGIVAFVYGADYEVTCCYNTGNITGGTGSVAGITPSNSYVPVTNCYNTGDITTANSTSGGYGGIVNSIYQSTVSYVFNTGRLIETTSYKYNSRGSIASGGENGASIHHAYFLNTSYNKGIGWGYGESGPKSGCSSTSLTAAKMKTQSSFEGWDFDNVWIMDNDAGHPVLRHVHDYCCDADEDTDTITVACERPYGNAKCYCENAGEEYTLTLIHPTLEQERCGGNAEATLDADELAIFNAGTGLNVSSNNITYEKREGSSVTSLGTTAPTTYGDYTVKLTVNDVFVSYDYTIEKLEVEFGKEVLLNDEPSTTTVSNLNGSTAAALLNEEEIESYLNDEVNVNIYLKVTTESSQLNIPTTDKSLARAAVESAGAKQGAYLDLSLFKKVVDKGTDASQIAPTPISESATDFDVTIDIPASLAAPFGCTRTYSIVRVHDGVAETLPSTVSNGKISFSTNKFSTYLIAYSDTFDSNGKYIEFTVDVDGENTRYVDSSSIGDNTVTVTYKITHNDGFNSILLIPEYDTNVFEIANNSDITVSDALGDAMITEETTPRTLPLKIELGATGDKYTTLDEDLGENVFFLTIKYTIKAALEGDYDFSLVLSSQGDNTASEAYYIENEGQKGEQNQVAIKVIMEEPLTLLVKETPVITIGYNNNTNHYIFEYGKAAVSTDKVAELIPGDNSLEPADPADLTVYYTFKDASGNEVAENDLPAITPSWFYYDNNDWTAMDDASPVLPGTYKVVISSAAEGEYYAAEDKYAYVEIVPRVIYVDVNDASSAYGEPLADLTAGGVDETTGELTSTAICEEDAIYITLSTNATSESIPGGDYYIRGAVDTENSVGYSADNVNLYQVIFRRVETQEVCDSVYTITKKQVTLTALDQFAPYTGNEPEVDQTLYTLEGIESTGLVIIITKESGVDGGDYELTPSFEIAPDVAKYEIEYVKGTFTIGGANDDYFRQFFVTKDWVYNGEDQVVIEGSNIPAWVTKVEIKALQVDDDYTEGTTLNKKNAGTYYFVVKLTLEDAKYSSSNTTEVTISHDPDNEKPLTATISPAQVTLTAVNKEVYYGEGEHLPYVPEFSVEGTTEELDYSWAITNDNVAFTPAADTDVGNYPIVITEGINPNFIVTVVNGIYKVKQAQATVTAGASDVYYNRALVKTVSGSVNTLSLTPTVTYYTDSECTQAVDGDPVDVGEYWAKAVVAETPNYLGAEAVAPFHILPVQLEGITFTYSHGNVTWTAIANDAGKTNAADEDEEGVDAAALKEGTTITYEVYNGETCVATIAPGETCTFNAAAATTYKVVAVASDANYISNEATTVTAYEVSFNEGDHAGNPSGVVTNMPDKQYIFAGETAVQPQTNPSVISCTFSAWQVGGNSYAFNVPVNENITVVAIWDATTYTITFKFLTTSHTTSGENQDVFAISGYIYGSAITYSVATIDPVKESGDDGIYYTFANKWIYNETEYTITVENGTATINGITVPESNMEFIAVFDTNYNSFTISYYLSSSTSTEEEDYQLIATQYATYGDVIFYREIETSNIAWFKIEGWFANMERTDETYTTMPAQDISVYSGYAFDIGTGDVNGDGDVNVEDITLYRQWIVGGYEMIVVEPGTEWTTVNGEGFSLENTYFIKRVADNNKDESRDVRDVTVIRMSIVGGYSWDIVSDEVSGQSIARSASIYAASAIVSGFNTYGRVRLYVDITDTDRDLTINTINTTKNVYIDLGGKTLTLKSLTIRTSGKGAKIVIENGTIVTTNGITIAAANGQVIVDKVTGYAGGSINLQSSESGLYFEGANAFYSGSSTSETPATVQVEEGSHVVINEGATLTVEKILVTENSFAQEAQTSTITYVNNTENSIAIEGPYIDISND